MSLILLRRAALAALVALLVAVCVVAVAVGGRHAHSPGHRADPEKGTVGQLIDRVGDRMGVIRAYR